MFSGVATEYFTSGCYTTPLLESSVYPKTTTNQYCVAEVQQAVFDVSHLAAEKKKCMRTCVLWLGHIIRGASFGITGHCRIHVVHSQADTSYSNLALYVCSFLFSACVGLAVSTAIRHYVRINTGLTEDKNNPNIGERAWEKYAQC